MERAVDEAGFWAIVEQARTSSNGDMDRLCERLKRTLAKLPKGDALAFRRHFDEKMNGAYSHELWGAAYVIHGGCSDDAFADFRSSLISRGRVAFERAIADPDALADETFDEDAWFYESVAYAVSEGVEAAVKERVMIQALSDPTGTAWEEEDLGDLYPRLTAKFA